jgi:hypothetical protein
VSFDDLHGECVPFVRKSQHLRLHQFRPDLVQPMPEMLVVPSLDVEQLDWAIHQVHAGGCCVQGAVVTAKIFI